MRRFKFALIDSDSKYAKKFDVPSYPALILQQYDYDHSNMSEYYYSGPDKYTPMKKWLMGYIQQVKIPVKQEAISQEEEEFSFKVIKYAELQSHLKKHDEWVLAHFKEKESHPALKDILARFGAFFKYVEIVCDSACRESAKSELEISEYPSMLVFPLGFKNSNRKIDIGNMNEDTLLDALLKEVPLQLKSIGESPLVEFLQPVLNSSKYPVLALYKSEDKFTRLVLQSFQAMRKYQETLSFGRKVDPPPEQVHDVNPSGELPYTFAILDIKD